MVKIQLHDPLLHRYWFTMPGGFSVFGIGVTAYSLDDAQAIIQQALIQDELFDPWGARWVRQEISEVIEDVDVRQLDQGHVIPNMGPPNFRGIWWPRLNMQ